MRKSILITFIVIFNLAFGQEKIYRLISKTENSDIDYKSFERFDDFDIYKNNGLKNAFKPVSGKHTVYFFISEFMGDSFDGTRKTFHDYLILKTNQKSNLITDGFQFTIEWAEPPASTDLYRLTQKTEKIRNNLSLNLLKMQAVDSEYYGEINKELNDNGILKLE
ncbi:MAG: hypothetical protein WBF83_09680 [Moheibacter sp.]